MPDGSLRDRSQEVIDAYHALRLDALIGVGGDGSFAILRGCPARGGLPSPPYRRRSTVTCAMPTGAETCVTVLDHLQRGGQPTAGDRLLASAFEIHSVDLVAAGGFDDM